MKVKKGCRGSDGVGSIGECGGIFFRGGLVTRGFHGAAGAPLAEAADGAAVTEEFFEGGVGGDDGHLAATFGLRDHPAALLQIADEFAHVGVGGADFEPHDRLEKDRLGLFDRLIEGVARCDPKGDLIATFFVDFAPQQFDFHSGEREAGDDATPLGTLDQFLQGDGAQVGWEGRFGGDAIDHLDRGRDVIELGDPNPHPSEELLRTHLTVALPFDLGGGRDRLAVIDPRLVKLDLQAEIAGQAVLDHFEVKFTHPAYQGLAELFVFGRAEGGVLPFDHFERFVELFAIGGAFGFDRHREDGLGELDARQFDRFAGVAEGIAGDRGPGADDATDVAGTDHVDLAIAIAFAGVDLPELRDVFFGIAVGASDA